MAVREILLLGNEDLYSISSEISPEQIEKAKRISIDLHDTMLDFKEKYRFGRAIAAPQIGEFWRIIYMNWANHPYVLVNPRLQFGEEQFEVWDDCMSFPGLEVKLKRYKKTTISYKDLEWNECALEFENDLSELIQHEYDHLDGILAVQKALDSKSFRINRLKAGCY